MTRTLTRILGVVGVLALTVPATTAAVANTVVAEATPAQTGSPATDARTSVAGAAVAAVTTQPVAVAAATIPADFESVMGYQPRVRHGVLVDPDGSCSSPVPLPRGFALACAEHDLGYDLLRYADLSGAALGPWARTAVDDRMVQRMRAACADLDPGISRALCSVADDVAGLVVEINSLRQLRGVPEETVGSWVVTGLSAGVLAALFALLAAALTGGRGRRGHLVPQGVPA
jgi:hypothetical protein